jgi:predicted nucleotidyltransferase
LIKLLRERGVHPEIGARLAFVPKTGIIIPNMGTKSREAPSGLANALFTPVQGRVLALLFGQPDRRYQSAEVIRLATGGTGAVHRQLARLAAAGLVTVTRSGNQKHYQARRDSPVFQELHGLVVKTVGLVEPIREALSAHKAQITAAFIYGSTAKGTDTGGSDIDLMVISDTLDHAALYEALQRAEAVLARPVNPTVMTTREWRAKVKAAGSFAGRIARGARLYVIGSDDDLA